MSFFLEWISSSRNAFLCRELAIIRGTWIKQKFPVQTLLGAQPVLGTDLRYEALTEHVEHEQNPEFKIRLAGLSPW